MFGNEFPGKLGAARFCAAQNRERVFKTLVRVIATVGLIGVAVLVLIGGAYHLWLSSKIRTRVAALFLGMLRRRLTADGP